MFADSSAGASVPQTAALASRILLATGLQLDPLRPYQNQFQSIKNNGRGGWLPDYETVALPTNHAKMPRVEWNILKNAWYGVVTKRA